MNLYQLMILVRDQPESFLREDCVFQLAAFIRGFILAKNIEADGISEDHKIFEDFVVYVRNNYEISYLERGSVEEIVNDAEQKKSFEKYLALWFTYVKS